MARLCLIFFAILLFVSSAHADAPMAGKIAGTYSNLRYNSEGGDLLGMELLILPGGTDIKPGWNVFVQIAEGGVPFVAVVPMTVNGKQIEFTLPTGGNYSGKHFTGTLGATTITVRWSGGTTEVLNRGKSYWQ